MNAKSLARLVVLFALAAGIGAAALAQGPGNAGPGSAPRPGMGPGMMQHPPAGMMQHAPGGMMPHSPAMGRPMMGGGRLLDALNINDEQRRKIVRIREDTRRKSWDLVGQLMSERFKLREIYDADKIDANAAVEQKRKIDDLSRQVMKSRLEARNQIEALLTREQRQKFRSLAPVGFGGNR
jgi:Spy/CpxP family protein refolding chaperone